MNGFLGTGAPLHADVNLVLQVAMGIALLVGKVLARAKRFRAHQFCQMSVVLFNLVLIGSIMAPSFGREVAPNLRKAPHDLYYGLGVVHAALGTVVELLAIYVILVAATSWIPERFRFKTWRNWMGATLALWWLVILLGIALYVRWYVIGERARPDSASNVAGFRDSIATITAANFRFSPNTLTVRAGTTVAWVDTLGRHVIEMDDKSFISETLLTGKRVTRRFDTPGTYLYHCQLHGDAGLSGMSGTIVVTPR